VQPIFIRGRLAWEEAELSAAQAFLAGLGKPNVRPLVVLEMPADDLYGNHWSVTASDVPGADTCDEAVYLPGRNVLLLVKAMLWCGLNGVDRLALGILGSNPFGDATDEFFVDFQSAMARATGTTVIIVRPFARYHKLEVIALGSEWPLEQTFSCIAPAGGLHCGRCNKCAERKTGFARAGMIDKTCYRS
jgi:7-cyano-7-deazaguanine synthase